MGVLFSRECYHYTRVSILILVFANVTRNSQLIEAFISEVFTQIMDSTKELEDAILHLWQAKPSQRHKILQMCETLHRQLSDTKPHVWRKMKQLETQRTQLIRRYRRLALEKLQHIFDDDFPQEKLDEEKEVNRRIDLTNKRWLRFYMKYFSLPNDVSDVVFDFAKTERKVVWPKVDLDES